MYKEVLKTWNIFCYFNIVYSTTWNLKNHVQDLWPSNHVAASDYQDIFLSQKGHPVQSMSRGVDGW